MIDSRLIKQNVLAVHWRTLSALFFATVVLLSVFIVATPASKASAWAGDAIACPQNDLPNWDWPAILKQGGHPNNNEKQAWTDFNPETSSYVIGKGISNAGNLMIYRSANGTPLRIVKNAGTGYNEIVADGGYLQKATFSESGNGDFGDINDYSTFNFVGQDTSPRWGGADPGDPATEVCIYRVKNVEYGSTYVDKLYSENISYADPAQQCEALEIGCWIGQIFDNMVDNLESLGRAIMTGLAWLFMPDATRFQDAFDGAGTFFTDKLGFLLYPVDFLADLFSEIGDPSEVTCTSSSCTKSFGNLFGGNFTVDFLAVKNDVSVDLWNYMLLAIRGLTVLGLVIMLRQKLIRVLSK